MNVSIVGPMNAGKSTLMNLLTQQATSIVDATPGTTADNKVALMEIHALGAVKLIDTPGADERGELGGKKRLRAVQALKESDVALLVVDPLAEASERTTAELLDARKEAAQGCRPVVIYNVRRDADQKQALSRVEEIEEVLQQRLGGAPLVSLVVDLHAEAALQRVLQLLVGVMQQGRRPQVSPLPPGVHFDKDSRVLLNVPMDAESPGGRLLRPQALVQEALLREFVGVFAYRMDLAEARSSDPSNKAKERRRFRENVEALATGKRLKLIVTDSQAVGEAAAWSEDLAVPITTFSVAMAHLTSGGRLPLFVEGIKAFERLKPGSRVLICEACNHDRIQDDIGTVQLPKALKARFGADGIRIDHSFGRQYQTFDLRQYSLILHCGGCMLDQQQMGARLADLETAGVPITNYGLLLSYLSGPSVLSRVLEPWSLS